jgi:uncharacterized protein (TIGR03000 family)
MLKQEYDQQAPPQPPVGAHSLRPPTGEAPQEARAQPGSARVTVIVPAGASVFFEGVATDQTGVQRTYVTPKLAAGRNYHYKIEARWTAADGTPVDETRTIIVTAGAKVEVDFTNQQ